MGQQRLDARGGIVRHHDCRVVLQREYRYGSPVLANCCLAIISQHHMQYHPVVVRIEVVAMRIPVGGCHVKFDVPGDNLSVLPSKERVLIVRSSRIGRHAAEDHAEVQGREDSGVEGLTFPDRDHGLLPKTGFGHRVFDRDGGEAATIMCFHRSWRFH